MITIDSCLYYLIGFFSLHMLVLDFYSLEKVLTVYIFPLVDHNQNLVCQALWEQKLLLYSRDRVTQL